MSTYSCKHVGIRENSSQSRICASRKPILGYYYWASTWLRYQRFENRLKDEPRVGTPICQNLLGTPVLPDFLLWQPKVQCKQKLTHPLLCSGLLQKHIQLFHQILPSKSKDLACKSKRSPWKENKFISEFYSVHTTLDEEYLCCIFGTANGCCTILLIVKIV